MGRWHRPNKTCNSCGCRDLHWEQTDRGWRLAYENGQLHECAEFYARKAIANRDTQEHNIAFKAPKVTPLDAALAEARASFAKFADMTTTVDLDTSELRTLGPEFDFYDDEMG